MAKFKTKQQRRTVKRQKKLEVQEAKFKRQDNNDIRMSKLNNNNNTDKKTHNKFSKHKKMSKKDESDSESEVEIVPEKTVTNPAGDTKSSAKVSDHSDDDSDQEFRETRKLVTEQNRKKKKSGGFQSMGLSHSVYNGVIRKGYKVPTPIQRKTIPLIMDGKDVVAMARTGSGKTAAFLVPLFERLRTHSGKAGARAIILSPTRELALQTLKFTKELGKFTGLRAAVILGGDRMEDQFSALHNNPDIIIATPGRFLHVLVEMEFKLNSVEYVVFDEADRLFEMGFREQLNEIIHRLPESRQTVLFSATLPKLLVEFAKAGLHDPVLIRLDVDAKISDQLQTSFLQCRAEDKPAVLLSLLTDIIPSWQQAVVFVATKHHVEYLNMLLSAAGISCSYIYSSLDQTARKIAVAKFQHRKCSVLIVTDLAARGIDIPMLDNVINYNFPAKPKLFVHRVGRVARAGRSGVAYSLISPDELPFLMDLHLFLGRPLKLILTTKKTEDTDGCLGAVPQSVIDEQSVPILQWTQASTDLQNMKRVCSNAYKNYLRSRPASSTESIKRCKQMDRDKTDLAVHPIYDGLNMDTETERTKLLTAMRSYKPQSTIFEINSTARNKAFDVMKKKRSLHEGAINNNSLRIAEKQELGIGNHSDVPVSQLDGVSQDEVERTFSTVIVSRKGPSSGCPEKKGGKTKRPLQIKDEENYLNYKPSDFQSEKGLSLGNSFEQQATGAVLDLTGDDNNNVSHNANQLKWDRKKKKFLRVGQDERQRRIQTESGAWIPASYRSNLYKDWLTKNKIDGGENESDDEDPRGMSRFTASGTTDRRKRWHTAGPGSAAAPSRSKKMKFSAKGKELRRPEQILKIRKKKEKQHAFQQKQHFKRQKRKQIQNNKTKKSF